MVQEIIGVGAPEEGLCCGSLDVKALYPSLVIKECAKIAKERLVKSPLEIEGADYKWASVYGALTNTRDQVIAKGMAKLIPFRVTKTGKVYNGTYPTVKTIYTDKKNEKP